MFKITIISFLLFFNCTYNKKQTNNYEVINQLFLQIVDTIGYVQNSIIYTPNYSEINFNKKLRVIGVVNNFNKIQQYADEVNYYKNNATDKILINNIELIKFEVKNQLVLDSFNTDEIRKNGRYKLISKDSLLSSNLDTTINFLGTIHFSEFVYSKENNKCYFFIEKTDNKFAVHTIFYIAEKLKNIWKIIYEDRVQSSRIFVQ